MIWIIVEKSYRHNNRADALISGVVSVARKKREKVEVYQEIAELPNECKSVIVICQSLQWLTETVKELNNRGVHPLVFGFQYFNTLYEYSCLTPNYTKAAYCLTKFMLQKNPQKTAVLGYNEDSLPDRLKLTGIYYALEEIGENYQLFHNRGNACACLDEFAKNCEGIKNIVCCNDSLAVLLYTKYPHLLQGRNMGSCSGLKISEFFEEPYPVCRINYSSAGEMLGMMYMSLKKNTFTPTMMMFEMIISDGESVVNKKNLQFRRKGKIYTREEVDFYNDSSLEAIESLDRLLASCDETDLKILQELKNGFSYEMIAERLYLGNNTVKYRVKKLLELACVKSRRELLELFEKYRVKLSVKK